MEAEGVVRGEGLLNRCTGIYEYIEYHTLSKVS